MCLCVVFEVLCVVWVVYYFVLLFLCACVWLRVGDMSCDAAWCVCVWLDCVLVCASMSFCGVLCLLSLFVCVVCDLECVVVWRVLLRCVVVVCALLFNTCGCVFGLCFVCVMLSGLRFVFVCGYLGLGFNVFACFGVWIAM